MNYRVNQDNSVEIHVNTKIYPIDVIYSVGFLYTEEHYVMLDGDPNEEIIITLKSKNNKEQDYELTAKNLFNDLIVYADYSANLKKNINLRNVILRRLLLTNLSHEAETQKKESDFNSDYMEKELKPWKRSEK